MSSAIILLGILGYLFNAVFLLVERRVLAWTAARAPAPSDPQPTPRGSRWST